MKKLALLLALSVSVSPAFAAASGSKITLGNGGFISKITGSQTYDISLPFGFGKGGDPIEFTKALPLLGTLMLEYQNTGKGGTISYSESLKKP